MKPEGYCGGQEISRKSFTCRDDARFDLHTADRLLAAATARAHHQIAAETNLRPPVRLQGPRWKNRRETAPGGWSAPSRRARFATSPARFPAAANRKFPSRSPTAIIHGPVFVADFKKDFDQVDGADPPRLLRPVSRSGEKRRSSRAHAERGTLARLGHQTAHAGRARLYSDEYNDLARARFRNTSRNWCSW